MSRIKSFVRRPKAASVILTGLGVHSILGGVQSVWCGFFCARNASGQAIFQQDFRAVGLAQ